MIIRVSISREYDTDGEDHGHLFEGVEDPIGLALRYFTEDLSVMGNDEIKEQAFVETDGEENGYEMSDVEADADTLASAGWGTDEDYGG